MNFPPSLRARGRESGETAETPDAKLEKAMKSADPELEVDPENGIDIWTENGDLAMLWIEARMEDSSLTRKDLERVIPGFNRGMAREMRAGEKPA